MAIIVAFYIFYNEYFVKITLFIRNIVLILTFFITNRTEICQGGLTKLVFYGMLLCDAGARRIWCAFFARIVAEWRNFGLCG